MYSFYLHTFILSSIFVYVTFNIYIIGTLKPVEFTAAYDCAKQKIKQAMDEDIYTELLLSVFNITNASSIKKKWNKTLDCLNTSSVYYPFVVPDENVMAYVYPNMNNFYPNRIFVNKKYFKNATLNVQANVLIHECTHLGFDSMDYAYMHEDKFVRLRGNKALRNADTHVLIINGIKNNCYF